MKKIISILATLIIAVTVVGCSEKKLTSSDFNTETNKICTVKDYEFEIPKNWWYYESDGEIEIPDEDRAKMQVFTSDTEAELDMEDEEAQEYVNNAIFLVGENPEIYEHHTFKLGLETAYSVRLSCEIAGENTDVIATAYSNDECLFIFCLLEGEKCSTDYSWDYDKILGSIERVENEEDEEDEEDEENNDDSQSSTDVANPYDELADIVCDMLPDGSTFVRETDVVYYTIPIGGEVSYDTLNEVVYSIAMVKEVVKGTDWSITGIENFAFDIKDSNDELILKMNLAVDKYNPYVTTEYINSLYSDVIRQVVEQ